MIGKDDLRTFAARLPDISEISGGLRLLKKSVLDLAMTGQLSTQNRKDGDAQEILNQAKEISSFLATSGHIRKVAAPGIAASSPLQLPAGWQWAYAASLCSVITDGDHQAPTRASTGVPFVVIGDISAGGLHLSQVSRFVSKDYFAKLDWSHQPRPGDVLYTTVGASLGIPVPVPAGTKEFCFQRHIGVFRPALPEMQRFLYRFLQSDVAFQFVRTSSTGTAQKTVPLSALRKLLVPVPPLAEQDRIVILIDELFDLIDKVASKRDEAEVARRALSTAALRELGRELDPFAINRIHDVVRRPEEVKAIDNVVADLVVSGKIRRKTKSSSQDESGDGDWSEVDLRDLAQMTNGRAFKTSEWRTVGLPIIRIGNLNNRAAEFNYVDPNIVQAKHMVDDGDILLSWSGTPGTSFGVFIWERGPGALNQHIFKCTLSPEISKEWFRLAVNLRISEMLESAHGGVGLKHLTKKQLDAIRIPLPSLGEQDRLLAEVDDLKAFGSRVRGVMTS